MALSPGGDDVFVTGTFGFDSTASPFENYGTVLQRGDRHVSGYSTDTNPAVFPNAGPGEDYATIAYRG